MYSRDLAELAAILRSNQPAIRETMAGFAHFAETSRELNKRARETIQLAVKQIQPMLPSIQTAMAAMAEFQAQIAPLPKLPPLPPAPPLPRLPYVPSVVIESEPTVLPDAERSENRMELEQEIQRLRRENRNLKWFLLEFGTDYPPASWDSFEDFTDLSEN